MFYKFSVAEQKGLSHVQPHVCCNRAVPKGGPRRCFWSVACLVHQAGPSQLTHMEQYALPVVTLKCGRRICGYSIQDSIRSSLNAARPAAHLPLPFMAKSTVQLLFTSSLSLEKNLMRGKSCSLPSLPVMHTPQGTRFLPQEWQNPRQRFSPLRWPCPWPNRWLLRVPNLGRAGRTGGDSHHEPPHGRRKAGSRVQPSARTKAFYPWNTQPSCRRITTPISRATSTVRSCRLSSDPTSGISAPRWCQRAQTQQEHTLQYHLLVKIKDPANASALKA